ncbi:MAG: LytTR family transcriptional regulator [Flavobacteriaceae bacterium]
MNIFRKEHPYHPLSKYHILIAIGLALWIFLFLFFIKPLTVESLNLQEQLFFLPIYGLVSGLSYLAIILPQSFLYRSQKERWSVFNEIIILLALSIISVLFIWVFFRYAVTVDDTIPYEFGEFLIEIFLPAYYIILPLVFIARFFLGKYYQRNREKITIQGSGNYEHLHLFLKDLVYIQSSNNYVEVYHLQKNEIKTTVIRTNLSKVEEAHPNLLKIHRSYLINSIHYQEWKIEKGKHFIVLYPTEKLPVSKTHLDNVKATLNFTTN